MRIGRFRQQKENKTQTSPIASYYSVEMRERLVKLNVGRHVRNVAASIDQGMHAYVYVHVPF
jgi:hypothetical protein